MRRVKQQGFNLPDALLALLLFSVTALGLLRYHQTLLQQVTLHRYQQQARFLAQNALNSQSITGEKQRLPAGWKQDQQVDQKTATCSQITITITPPIGQPVRLSRWFCE